MVLVINLLNSHNAIIQALEFSHIKDLILNCVLTRLSHEVTKSKKKELQNNKSTPNKFLYKSLLY